MINKSRRSYIYIWCITYAFTFKKSTIHVGEYTIPMDGMGKITQQFSTSALLRGLGGVYLKAQHGGGIDETMELPGGWWWWA